MLCELDIPEPYEPLAADVLHERSMRMGSLALLRAMEQVRPPAPAVSTPRVTAAARPPRRVSKGLWPAWYQPPRPAKRGHDLLKSIAQDFGLTLSEMRGAGREGFLVDARAVAAMVLRERGLSYPQIARIIGRKDHSTVLNLTNKFDIFCRRNPLVKESYEAHREGSAL